MMTSRPSRGHEEIPHTADWALRVWAEDLPSLFEEAARGMDELAGRELEPAPRVSRSLELETGDEESLLVAFLSELLYLQEQEHLGFDVYQIEIQAMQLKAQMEGARLRSLAKPIKAVTFHNLHIAYTGSGCEVELVFDV
jgi:SHS2 domain-containing protein